MEDIEERLVKCFKAMLSKICIVSVPLKLWLSDLFVSDNGILVYTYSIRSIELYATVLICDDS